MYTVESCDAEMFLDLSDSYVSENLSDSVNSYIQTNLKFLAEYDAPNIYHHLIFYAVNYDKKIVGFRYLFYKENNRFCHLFATYVDEDYRRNGIAKNLIMTAMNNLEQYNFNEFEIRLTQPTPEKDALFKLYCDYAQSDEKKGSIQFIIGHN